MVGKLFMNGMSDFLLSIGLDFGKIKEDSKKIEKIVGKDVINKLAIYFKNLQNRISQLETKLSRMQRGLTSTRKVIEKFKGTTQQAVNELKSFADQEKEVRDETEKTDDTFKRHGNTMLANIANAAKWAAIYFVIYRVMRGVTSAFQQSLDSLEEFDTGMRRTLRLSAASREEYGKLLKTHQALNTELRRYAYWNGITYQDLQEISYQLKSAGRDVEQVKDQFKALAEFKIIFPEVDVTNLVKMTTGLVNVFGERGVLAEFATEGDKLNRILDMMVSLIAEHKVEASEIPVFMQYAAQSVKAYGGTLEETIAAQAVFQDNMIKSGIAARTLRQFLDQLAKKYKDIGEIFDIGLDPKKTFYAQMIPFLKALAEKTEDNLESQAKLAQVFQTRARPMVQLFTKDMQRYIKTLEELVNSEGSRARSLEVLAQSISFQKTVLSNVWKELTTDILGDDVYLSTLKMIIDLLRSIHEKILWIKYDINKTLLTVKEFVPGISEINETWGKWLKYLQPTDYLLSRYTENMKKLKMEGKAAAEAAAEIQKGLLGITPPPKIEDWASWMSSLGDISFEEFQKISLPDELKDLSEERLKLFYEHYKRLGQLREIDARSAEQWAAKVKQEFKEVIDALGAYTDEEFERLKRLQSYQKEYDIMGVYGKATSEILDQQIRFTEEELKITDDLKERKKLELELIKLKDKKYVALLKEGRAEEKLVLDTKQRIELIQLETKEYKESYKQQILIQQLQEKLNSGLLSANEQLKIRNQLEVENVKLQGLITKENKEHEKQLDNLEKEHHYELMKIGFLDEEIISRQKIADLQAERLQYTVDETQYGELGIEILKEQNRLIQIQLEKRAQIASDIASGLGDFYISSITGEYAGLEEAGRGFAQSVTDVLSNWTSQYFTKAIEQALFDLPMMQTMAEIIYNAHVRGAEYFATRLYSSDIAARASELGMTTAEYVAAEQKAAEEIQAGLLGTTPPTTSWADQSSWWGLGLTNAQASMVGMSMAVPIASWAAGGGGAFPWEQMVGSGMMTAGATMMSTGNWWGAALLGAGAVLSSLFGGDEEEETITEYTETLYQNTAALEHLSEEAELLSRNLLGLRQVLDPYPFMESYYFSAGANTRMIGGGTNVTVYIDGVEQRSNVTFEIDSLRGYQR